MSFVGDIYERTRMLASTLLSKSRENLCCKKEIYHLCAQDDPRIVYSLASTQPGIESLPDNTEPIYRSISISSGVDSKALKGKPSVPPFICMDLRVGGVLCTSHTE